MQKITPEQIDLVLARWEKAKRAVPIVINDDPMFAKYNDAVSDFFSSFEKAPWLDIPYERDEAQELLARDDFPRNASLGELRLVLTAITRGERFAAGLWEDYMKNGVIGAIMKRLEEFR